ncbi:MAG: UbiA family prenyltransferase [Candidatus Micrarchaeaceae archaeon]|jgi:geranylgeranylglycerol-phosphate geranylgeranyltransferase
MGIIKAIIKLTRIEHSIMLVIAVIAAELIAGILPSPLILALSIITPIFISMGSFAINDYYDVESDRANKRIDRPIVNGSIGKSNALKVALLCFIIGVLASIFINAIAFAIALIFAILAILYSYKMKDMVLLGNIYIAFSMVIPFIYGDYVVSKMLGVNIIIISIIIFLAGLAREIHGMIRDYKGDSKARNSKNLLKYVSNERAAQLAFILYIEAILVSIYAFFFTAPFAFNALYAFPIAIVDIILAYFAVGHLIGKKSTQFYKSSRNLTLAAMGLALLAFLISALYFIRI